MVSGMQYRWNFMVEGAMSVVFAFIALLPLWVLKSNVRQLEGWTFPEMMVVVGWFTLLKGVLDGGVNPALIEAVEKIRMGTLDFVLLKPADAQFLISTAKFNFWKAIDVLAGLSVLSYAFFVLGRPPALHHVLVAFALLGTSCLVLYSIWILVISAAFWVVRLDNLVYLFMSLFDFARWPVTIFRGFVRIFFTFVIPLALMTTYPSLALLGKLSLRTGLWTVAGALGFAALARQVWLKAIGHYTSASS